MKPASNFSSWAIVVLLAVIMMAPNIVLGLREKAQADALSAREPAQATALYESAAGRLFWQKDLLQRAAESALAAGNQNDAVRLFEQAEAHNSLSPAGHNLLGEIYFTQGNLDKAILEWQKAQKAGTQSAQLYNRIGQAYILLGQYDEARAAFSHARDLDASDAYSRYWLGLVLATCCPQESISPLLEAAKLDPALDPIVQSLRQGINAALLNPTQAGQLTGSARVLLAVGETTLAAEAIHQAQSADPGYAPAYAWLGAIQEAQGEDGLTSLQKAIELDPRHVDAYILLGAYWQKRANITKALAAYEKAVQIEPGNPTWLVTLASAQASNGNLPEAADNYQRAIQLDPQNSQFWRLLANFCVDYNYKPFETGLPAALQAYTLAPETPETLVTLGRVNFAIGETESARKLWLKALDISPNDPAPLLYLGILSLQENNTAQAGNYLTRAAALDPEGPYGKQAASIIERYLK